MRWGPGGKMNTSAAQLTALLEVQGGQQLLLICLLLHTLCLAQGTQHHCSKKAEASAHLATLLLFV